MKHYRTVAPFSFVVPLPLSRRRANIYHSHSMVAVNAPARLTSACQKIDIYLNPKNKWRFKIAKNFHVR